jgi:site-specific DNA-cytosine methylase
MSNNIFLSGGKIADVGSKINVLSLFDGMSCGQIALDKLGIEVDNYFASEIDKYAMQVTKHNYPNTKHIGDVTKVKGADLPKIDLLIGGSPCQGFSFAGKQLNFDDPRSKLFFEFVRLLKETNPKYFLLENVKMKKEYEKVITDILKVEPIKINSSLVSAQNRERLYWTNIPNIMQPKDKGLFLKDVIEKGSGKLLTDVTAKRPRTLRNFRRLDQKAFCMLATMYKLSQSNGMTVIDDNGLRCISPIECERLQNVPDEYTGIVSNTQRYKMLGNGWTVDVITHIFNQMALQKPKSEERKNIITADMHEPSLKTGT